MNGVYTYKVRYKIIHACYGTKTTYLTNKKRAKASLTPKLFSVSLWDRETKKNLEVDNKTWIEINYIFQFVGVL